jgi:hypothetical protein
MQNRKESVWKSGVLFSALKFNAMFLGVTNYDPYRITEKVLSTEINLFRKHVTAIG